VITARVASFSHACASQSAFASAVAILMSMLISVLKNVLGSQPALANRYSKMMIPLKLQSLVRIVSKVLAISAPSSASVLYCHNQPSQHCLVTFAQLLCHVHACRVCLVQKCICLTCLVDGHPVKH